jgi:hypothetical protein
MAQFVDSLRLRWYKYVIEYDLQKQLAFFERVGEAWRKAFGDEPLFGTRDRSGGGGERRPGDVPGYWIAGALFAGLGAFWWWRRRAPATGPAPAKTRRPPVADLYRDLLAAYARLGHARPPSATAREFLAGLRERGAPDMELAERVVALYEAARFGGADAPADELRRLHRELKAVGRRPSA